MQDEISGQPLPAAFPYVGVITSLCSKHAFFPCLVGAVKMNETGLGQGPATETDISFDGGRGIMQLTSSYPSDWEEPEANIEYAITNFLLPAYNAFSSAPYSLQGDDLVRAIAAAFNEGLGTAEYDHVEYGNVDYGTTNEYGARALEHYQNLIEGVLE